MPSLHLHSQHRRPEPFKPSDYDHEINLLDEPLDSRTRSPNPDQRTASPSVASDSSSRRRSDVPLRKQQSLRKQLTHNKYKKYQDRHENDPAYQSDTEQATNGSGRSDEERGRKAHKEPESAIDILWENERGLFFFGKPLFSPKALGISDPPKWTNAHQKPSFTDITNHQLPDPTWEWQWKEWRINHDDGVDPDGWEYAFAFWKKCSFHEPGCCNSYVRRRAWIRKRTKKERVAKVQESHMLNDDYFTIHSAQVRSRSVNSSTGDGGSISRSTSEQRGPQNLAEMEDIRDIGALLKALRLSRIDREKMEAIENFITNGGPELYYLREHMHEIMAQFIFQASRRLLLSHLIKILNKATARESKGLESAAEDEKSRKEENIKNLQDAVHAADEEVKKLEYWSDVKEMAEKGETQGAVDGDQGWGDNWKGVDDSGPRPVITEREIPGTDDCKEFHVEKNAPNPKGKGKGKEQ
ncbi:Meiotically up-regulated gene 65 protein [Phlyctema vagabunda]|uniref:Meiotically up-regulated gene 65 protein n=1 Tax=Phlyctema vagabunda TaxID=108571 RepID=A0ABR4PMC8_9HELO